MGLFLIGSAALLALASLVAAWRRRGVAPYDDPLMTVEALHDRQRMLFEFGMAVGPWPAADESSHGRRAAR